jgi:DNA polymerase I-like protein with 3'-5' exonuclease and polymerase domains
MRRLPERVNGESVLTIDTETTGLDKMTDQPFCFLIQVDDGEPMAIRWDLPIIRWLDANLPKARVCVFHNAKFDFHMMRNGGVNPESLYQTNVHCTFVAEALIDEHQLSYSLDNLGQKYFGIAKDDSELVDWLVSHGYGKDRKTAMAHIQHAPWPLVEKYGVGDIRLTRKLFQRQNHELAAQNLQQVFDLEMDTLKALVEIEHRGVPVNEIKVRSTADQLEQRQQVVQSNIIKLVGWEVNPRSPLEMTSAFNKLGIPIRMNGNGRPTFAKDVLDSLDHPFINALKESRGIKTMMDTFIGGSIGKNLRNGRIHTDFNQVRGDDYGTGTGRLSSSGPNLQQVPKRDGELAPLIRGLFYGGHDKLWVANDWEQFEFRMFAHYVKDDALLRRYHDDPSTDFHQALSDMTGKPRDKAKRINLGLVFGMGEGKLAKEVGLPYTVDSDGRFIAGPEAKQLFAEYHTKFPKAKQFLEEASQLARSRGYVKTIFGRRLHFPGGEFTHKAGGLVFQGSSADIMKKKLVELNNEYRNTDVEFVLVVHDEFCLIAPEEYADKVARRVKEITEDVPELRVPVLAKANVGENWWEASK